MMQIDGVINYPLEEARAARVELATLPDDELRALFAESLTSQVMGVAKEELKRNRQKLKRSIETAGYEFETGVEVAVNDLGEHWVTFCIVFDGDYDGAAAAAEAWTERVGTFGGIDRVTHASLRGTDGTNAHMFDDEITALAENLDEDTKAQIDELMDPKRGGDV
jgi:hypothetical protein